MMLFSQLVFVFGMALPSRMPGRLSFSHDSDDETSSDMDLVSQIFSSPAPEKKNLRLFYSALIPCCAAYVRSAGSITFVVAERW